MSFKYTEPSPDLMSHEVILLCVVKREQPFAFGGVRDRRFKTGYRVLPESGFYSYADLYAPIDARYKSGQFWQIGNPNIGQNLGNYTYTHEVDGMAKFIQVSQTQHKNKHIFEKEGDTIDFFYMGSYYSGESQY